MGDEHEAKGAGLGSVLSRRIERACAGEETPQRAEMLSSLADAAGVTVDTVRRHLSGAVLCPPRARLESFASVLGCSAAELIAAAEADGCSYGDKGYPAAMLYDTLPSAMPCEIKADTKRRRIEGYANTFRGEENLDNQGDAILPGAFSKTLKDRFPRNLIKMLYWHQDPIGVPEHIEEDSKGLFTVSRMDDTPEADARLKQTENGTLGHMSIGFDPVREELIRNEEGFVKGRMIREVKLYEYSLVPWPADEDSVVTAVKGAGDRLTALLAQIGDLGYLVKRDPALAAQIDQKLAALRSRLFGTHAPESSTSLNGTPEASTRTPGVNLGGALALLDQLRSDVEVSRRINRLRRH